jgi:hypothetical protein
MGSPTIPVEETHIPLVRQHIKRLKIAHAFFANRDGSQIWGEWPGDDKVWSDLRERLEESERNGQGDWRVRCVVSYARHLADSLSLGTDADTSRWKAGDTNPACAC